MESSNNDSNNLNLKTITNLVTKSGVVYKIAYDVNKKVDDKPVKPIILRRDNDKEAFKIVMDRGEYDAVLAHFRNSHQRRKFDLTIGASLTTEDGAIYKLAYETQDVKSEIPSNAPPTILYQENEHAKHKIVADKAEYEAVLNLFKEAHKKQSKENV